MRGSPVAKRGCFGPLPCRKRGERLVAEGAGA
ncbi:hypothetical protein ELI_07630 [Erythrobacter litoralis HTCC2594]|uniref:Uncharacterized protein n=1 Tax=Erythrobacter litoralis (strain HTCC2594) TaxID=314225 RepID=Q2N9M3_ERYLH|nr:hypothetical protein ELI_07630 [Erythrobacter litoralis HTCC2594]